MAVSLMWLYIRMYESQITICVGRRKGYEQDQFYKFAHTKLTWVQIHIFIIPFIYTLQFHTLSFHQLITAQWKYRAPNHGVIVYGKIAMILTLKCPRKSLPSRTKIPKSSIVFEEIHFYYFFITFMGHFHQLFINVTSKFISSFFYYKK